jgi:hypothetical protein
MTNNGHTAPKYLHMHGVYRLLLALHITAAVGALGAELVLLALGLAALSGAAPATVFPAAFVAAAYVVRPLAVLTLLTGVVLALASPYGLVRHWWTLIKLAIVLALTGAVFFGLEPSLAESAGRAAAGAPVLRGQTLLIAAPLIAITLLFVAVLLGVFKPFGRIGARRR